MKSLTYPDKRIEDLMLTFEPTIGAEYTMYKNHVYRVFRNCLAMDSDSCNEEKYAIAAVFHDIGIWTDATIDYLSPSICRVRIYLAENNRHDWADEIVLMILWHHKISKYRGVYNKTVQTFRQADWMDVSLGVLAFGFNRRKLREIRKGLPNNGFHVFLLKKIIRNFFRHPLNPLPMFRY